MVFYMSYPIGLGRKAIYESSTKQFEKTKNIIDERIAAIQKDWKDYMDGVYAYKSGAFYNVTPTNSQEQAAPADALLYADFHKADPKLKAECVHSMMCYQLEQVVLKLIDENSQSCACNYLVTKLKSSPEQLEAYEKAKKLDTHPHAALIKRFPADLAFPRVIKLFHKILNKQMLSADQKDWKKREANSDLKLLTEELGINKLPVDRELRRHLVTYATEMKNFKLKADQLRVEITDDEANLLIAEASELNTQRGTSETQRHLALAITFINEQVRDAGLRVFDACSASESLAFLGKKDQIAFRSKIKEDKDLTNFYGFVRRFNAKLREELLALHEFAAKYIAFFKHSHPKLVIKEYPRTIPAPYVAPAKAAEEDVKADAEQQSPEPQQAPLNAEPVGVMNGASAASSADVERPKPQPNQVQQSPAPQAAVTPKPSATNTSTAAAASIKKPAEAPKPNEEPQKPVEDVNASNASVEPKKVSGWSSFCNWLCSIPTSIWNAIKRIFS
jgi:hypothetical protein